VEIVKILRFLEKSQVISGEHSLAFAAIFIDLTKFQMEKTLLIGERQVENNISFSNKNRMF
jgi:hypothetical protein